MWSKNRDCCVECASTEFKHIAKGMCNSCYLRKYRNDSKNKSRIASQKRDWYLKHHEQNLLKHKANREQRNFDGKRDAVLMRDDHKCVRCGSQNKLTVHHKDRNGRGSKRPNNKLSNLETVCRACHIEEHRKELVKARHAVHNKPKLGKSGRWSISHDACISCGTQNSAHAAGGLCRRCYQRKVKHSNKQQKMT